MEKKHGKNCQCVRCNPLGRPCDCDHCNGYRFKKELKALLEKYNASISFYPSGDSGAYGLYAARLFVKFSQNNKDIILANSWSLDKTDL